MNYADIKTVDIQDGTGVRVSLYVSGCHFHCKGCHNPEAWNFEYGKKYNEEIENYILEQLGNSYISGLSILGGEPLEPQNQKALVSLVKRAKEKYPDKDIWCYTGYDFEKNVLGEMYKKFEFTPKFLDNIDVIIDGEFQEDNKLIDLKFRGSTNQRKIDVKESIKCNKLVQLQFGDEDRYINSKEKYPKSLTQS